MIHCDLRLRKCLEIWEVVLTCQGVIIRTLSIFSGEVANIILENGSYLISVAPVTSTRFIITFD